MNSYKKLLKRYQGFGISFTIFILVAVGIFVGLLPAAGAILSMKKNVDETGRQIEVLQQKIGILDSIDETTYKNYLPALHMQINRAK